MTQGKQRDCIQSNLQRYGEVALVRMSMERENEMIV